MSKIVDKVIDAVPPLAGAAAGAALAGPAGGVLGSVLGAGLQLALEAGLRLRRAAFERFLARLGREVAPDATVEEVRGKLETLLESNGHAQEGVFDAVRRILENPAPEVAEALGALVAQYVDRAPDAFYRGVAHVLTDVSRDELADLRRLISAAGEAPGAGPLVYVLASREHPGEVRAVRGSINGSEEVPMTKHLSGVAHIGRLLLLLRTYGLADDTGGIVMRTMGEPGDGDYGITWDMGARIALDDARRIARLLQ
jgi:hypothetical protein